MIAFFLTILRLLKASYRAMGDPEFRALAFVNLVLLASGSVFYIAAENWGVIDSIYFCVMTMTTIGYGDLTPTTGISKIFTVVYALLSIGVFVSLAAKLAAAMMKARRKT